MVQRRQIFRDCKGVSRLAVDAASADRSLADLRCLTPVLRAQMTDVFEGSLIRVFRRLQELIRQMAMAAKAVGSEEVRLRFDSTL